MTGTRYAIYFSPEPESDLWLFGSRWLGRDSATGGALECPELKTLTTERHKEITAVPAKYGFHATLKPPFHLAKGCDRQILDEALEVFASVRETITVPALELSELDGFIALRPKDKCEPLDELATDCVRDFDHFRAPPTTSELARRNKANLTANQKKMLETWGYPYVMNEFRFHMTLTDRLVDDERKTVVAEIAPYVRSIMNTPVQINLITLYAQKNASAPFEVVKCYMLNGLPNSRWLQQKPR